MRNMWYVCKREFSSYFVTPVGYVILGTFALISGLGFAASFLFYCKITESPAMYAYNAVPDFEEALLSPFLVFCAMLIMFICPLVTMRLLAGEKNRGTMELLLTHPLRDREIIFGKFMAALGILGMMMISIIVHLLIIAQYADVEPAVLVFGLITVFLTGAAFISLGLFVSAMTDNPITAGAVTFVLWLSSWIIGNLGTDLPENVPIPDSWSGGVGSAVKFVYSIFRQFVLELPLDAHAKEMTQGVLDPKDIAYYVLVISFFIFLTFRALESRKWRA